MRNNNFRCEAVWPFGRLAVGVAVIAATCAMPAHKALAGQWQLIIPPDMPYQGDESAYLTQWGDYFSGTVTKTDSGAANGGYLYYPDPYVTTPSTTPFWKSAQRQQLYERADGTGGPAQLKAAGKVRFKLFWRRNTLVNGMPDASDNPPAFVYLSMNGQAMVYAKDANGTARRAANESATATISIEGTPQNLYAADATTPGHDTGTMTQASAVLNRVIKINTGGLDFVWTPWIKVDVNGSLTANRTYSENSYPGYPPRTFWSTGEVRVEDYSYNNTSWRASLLNLTLTPSPENSALEYRDGRRLNQYIIDAGIPTSISVTSSDAGFTESLRANSLWTLTGPSPAFRPFIGSVKEELNGTTTIRPQHAARRAGYPNVNGLLFNVQTSDFASTTTNAGWRFPADNSSFGVRTFSHYINRVPIPAPVALFYPSEGFQHPTGGPKGYRGDVNVGSQRSRLPTGFTTTIRHGPRLVRLCIGKTRIAVCMCLVTPSSTLAAPLTPPATAIAPCSRRATGKSRW